MQDFFTLLNGFRLIFTYLINAIIEDTLMKSMFTIAAATMIVISAFMQPAIAQRRTGNTYSGMGENQAGVLVQFNLVDKKRVSKLKNFQTITDAAKNNPNLGIFRGAIEKYRSGLLAWACSTTSPRIYDNQGNLLPPCNSGTRGTPDTSRSIYFFDDSGFLILQEVLKSSSLPFNGDLYAELIPKDPLFGGKRDTIAYNIFQPGRKQPIQSYRLDFSVLGVDQDKAINDLTYILKKDLFSQVILVRTSDIDKTSRLSPLANVLLQNRFTEEIQTPLIFQQRQN